MRITDGPYLFYNGNIITSIRGEFIKGTFISQTNSFPKSEVAQNFQKVYIPQNNSAFTFNILEDHQIPPYKYDGVNRIFSISDIEGDFDYFQKMLEAHGIMDEGYNWTFGTGHLVVLGDIFDRADLVTEVLWLMYKLEQEAKLSGGMVHVILGNHESMCLSGDERYIHKKYKRVCEGLGYRYRDLYSDKSVLGDWLRTKNSIEIINNIMFVHGGISPVLSASGMNIEVINNIVRSELDRTKSGSLKSIERLIMGSFGPLWYRGYVKQEIDLSDIKTILLYFYVDHMVIGHTVVDSVTALFDRHVIAIDIRRKNKEIYEALLIENGQFYKATSIGNKIPL